MGKHGSGQGKRTVHKVGLGPQGTQGLVREPSMSVGCGTIVM